MGPAPVHLEAPQAAGASPDLPPATLNSKSAQRAYLQSLDHSSRAWVLSSGKPQGSSVALSEESGGNIWYNPIPEEEDASAASTGVEIWRRRDEMMKDATTKRTGPAGTRADRSEPGEGTSLGHHPDDCREGAGEKLLLLLASVPFSGSFLLLLSRTPRLRLRFRLPKEHD